jgi:hypothetical protein
MSCQEEKQKRKQKRKKKKEQRRKKDCSIGMPFIIAFQGDPARKFYCNDVRDNGEPVYELIHAQSERMGYMEKKFARLRRYLHNHVVSMNAKVLIYKAGLSEVQDPYKKQKEEEEEED